MCTKFGIWVLLFFLNDTWCLGICHTLQGITWQATYTSVSIAFALYIITFVIHSTTSWFLYVNIDFKKVVLLQVEASKTRKKNTMLN